jgi:hypothetical protein
MRLNIKEIQAVSSLTGQQRYEYFIKKVADNNELWILQNNGWALVSDAKKEYLPIWSHLEFAELNRVGNWSNYLPYSIKLEDFISTILTQIQNDNISTCVFLTIEDYGVCPSNDQLKRDLLNEISLYE